LILQQHDIPANNCQVTEPIGTDTMSACPPTS
jgi:hypothetical protein